MSVKTIAAWLAVVLLAIVLPPMTIGKPWWSTEKTFAASGCVSAAEAAKTECAAQMEDAWYYGGAVDYARRDRIKDEPRCARVGEATYYACKGGTNE